MCRAHGHSTRIRNLYVHATSFFVCFAKNGASSLHKEQRKRYQRDATSAHISRPGQPSFPPFVGGWGVCSNALRVVRRRICWLDISVFIFGCVERLTDTACLIAAHVQPVGDFASLPSDPAMITIETQISLPRAWCDILFSIILQLLFCCCATCLAHPFCYASCVGSSPVALMDTTEMVVIE